MSYYSDIKDGIQPEKKVIPITEILAKRIEISDEIMDLLDSEKNPENTGIDYLNGVHAAFNIMRNKFDELLK